MFCANVACAPASAQTKLREGQLKWLLSHEVLASMYRETVPHIWGLINKRVLDWKLRSYVGFFSVCKLVWKYVRGRWGDTTNFIIAFIEGILYLFMSKGHNWLIPSSHCYGAKRFSINSFHAVALLASWLKASIVVIQYFLTHAYVNLAMKYVWRGLTLTSRC
jgi:hypothetical protein